MKEDMTASEMLRMALRDIRRYDCTACGAINILRRAFDVGDDDGTYADDLANTMEALADKVDAEIDEARDEAIALSLRASADIWAKANGWPDFKDGEDFGAWLERCALPRPRFEDGEPVQDSDMDEIGALTTCCIYTDGSWDFNPDKYEDERNPKLWDVQSGTRNDRIKRPAPEVLAADGKPVKAGDEGWFNYGDYGAIEVASVHPKGSAPGYEYYDYLVYTDGRLGKAKYFTHERPDTQEAIDADATRDPRAYYNDHIGHNVGLMDDAEVYEAVVAHLLKRQRALDARKGVE